MIENKNIINLSCVICLFLIIKYSKNIIGRTNFKTTSGIFSNKDNALIYKTVKVIA